MNIPFTKPSSVVRKLLHPDRQGNGVHHLHCRAARVLNRVPYRLEHVTLKHEPEGYQLNAIHVHPRVYMTPRTLVIYVHGYGRSGADAESILPTLLKNGIEVLTFDLPAHGSSEGLYCTFGVRERHCVRTVVTYVTKKKTEVQNIFIYGFSMGASSTLLYSALLKDALPPQVRGLILDSPFTSLRSVAYTILLAGTKCNKMTAFLICSLLRGPMLRILSRICQVKLDVNVLRDVKKRTKALPALFIHGDVDGLIDISQGRRLFAAYPTEEKDMIEVAGAGHTRFRNMDVMVSTLQFILKYGTRSANDGGDLTSH